MNSLRLQKSSKIILVQLSKRRGQREKREHGGSGAPDRKWQWDAGPGEKQPYPHGGPKSTAGASLMLCIKTTPVWDLATQARAE